MDSREKRAAQILNTKRIWWPIILGMGTVAYLIIQDNHGRQATLRMLYPSSGLAMLMALFMIFLRDAAYIWRLRILTQKALAWKESLCIVILWEFASSVTPSVVGGGLVAIFLLSRSRFTLGKSLAYVMLTATFDNLFFLFTAPIGYGNLLCHGEQLQVVAKAYGDRSLHWVFGLSYVLIGVYTFNMCWALLFAPHKFQRLLARITRISWFKRWKEAASQHSQEVIMASRAVRGMSPTYWIQLALTTLLAWTARYLTLNCLVHAYVPLSFGEHLGVLGKHVILWVVMLISPTPGSSGTAEFFFQQLYQPILGDYTLGVDLVWRLLTYYLYLVLGLLYLPYWIRKTATRTPKDTNQASSDSVNKLG